MTVLDLDVSAQLGDFALAVRTAAAAGDVVAVVGPNGAGKSTLLRAVAGLVPCTGRVAVNGIDVTTRPPAKRGVAWVPQDGALFPHLSVLDNVAFGVGGRHGRDAAHELLDRLGVADLAGRRPRQLSGGQTQKVALARALARSPRVLLLDEPLAALDVEARTEIRRALREHLAGFDGATLVVTHDAVDLVTLANRVLALQAGQVVQDANVTEASRAPRTPWLAALMGANAYAGVVDGDGVRLDDGGRLVAADLDAPAGSGVLAVVPAHAVVVHREQPSGSARNAWPVVVRQLTVVGGRVRIVATGTPDVVAEVTAPSVATLGLHEQAAAWVSVKATEVTVVVL